MIIPLYDTTAQQIAARLVQVRREGGAIALSRVLTLVVPVGAAAAERGIRAANQASTEHPSRIIVVVDRDPTGQATLDAEIRVGGDAGASEVIVLRLRGSLIDQPDNLITPLLLPDVPIVTWWPDRLPPCPAATPLGALAQRRVTDAAMAPGSLAERLDRLRDGYTPGDTDLSWTRITRWRAHLAAILDLPPYEAVTQAVVVGLRDHPSVDFLAGWLGWTLRCPIRVLRQGREGGLTRVELHRASGVVTIERPLGAHEARLITPGRPEQRFHLRVPSLAGCLSEELRRLDEDRVYGEVVTQGLPWLAEEDHLRELPGVTWRSGAVGADAEEGGAVAPTLP